MVMKKSNRFHPIFFVIFILTTFVFTQNEKDPWLWLNSLPKPWTLNQEEISKLLFDFQSRFPDFEDRLIAFASWRVGTPYEIFKLGEEVEPDLDPIIRLDVSDCTAHVLTTLTCVQSNSWEEARKNMISIHYKPNRQGKKIPTYVSRWHYTTDRITANPYTVDITKTLLPQDNLKSVNITLNKREDGSEFLDLNWEKEMIVTYIPNDKIDEQLLKKLPKVCGVAFIKPSYFKMGLAIGHEGMIVNQQYLIHASSSANGTKKVHFLNYYFPKQGPIFGGIMIYKFVPFRSD